MELGLKHVQQQHVVGRSVMLHTQPLQGAR